MAYNFTGTPAGDTFDAPANENGQARGLGSGDTLTGNSGKDSLYGNAGDDLLFADSSSQTAGGNDSLYGGQGSDTLVGARFGFSSDSLSGNRGEDLVIASTNGGNTLFGGQGDDTIYGSLTNGNTMNGDIGNDVLIAGLGPDRMLGASGNDTLVGGAGSNQMFGEEGNDQFQFFTAIPGDITLFTGAEQVIRSRGGFGGDDVINDFTTGDSISISQLDRNATVTVETNSAGAAVITIAGSSSDGQPANQTITVVGVTRDQLLAPGAQLIAINGAFITTNDTANTDGTSTFTVGGGLSGGNIQGLTLVGSSVDDAFSPELALATTAGGVPLVTTVNDDVATGLAGNDFIDGGAGNDNLDGGSSSSGFLASLTQIITTSTTSTDTTVATTTASATSVVTFTSIDSEPVQPFGPFGNFGPSTVTGTVTATAVDTATTTATAPGTVTATGTAVLGTTTWSGAYNPSVPGDTLVGNTGIDTLTGGTGSDEFRFVEYTAGEVDVITDYRRSENDIISIDASAFNAATGSALIAGALPSSPSTTLTSQFFMFDAGLGAPPISATNGTLGIASIYYDALGGGLYFDPDGAGAVGYGQFAQLSPAPNLGINDPNPGSFKIIA